MESLQQQQPPNGDAIQLSSSSNEPSPRAKSPAEGSAAAAAAPALVPAHVAVVCDGNARWAAQRSWPPLAGHAAGAARAGDVILALRRTVGVTHCTLYAFSTENWRRPAVEIAGIFRAVEDAARRLLLVQPPLQPQRRDGMFWNQPDGGGGGGGIVFKIIGDLDDERIPTSLRDVLRQLERETHAWHINNDADDGTNVATGGGVFTVGVAVNYGGRRDILNASRRLARQCVADSGTVNIDAIDEAAFAACLATAGMPDPDLIVRTGGEARLSNFLLWNAAYAELYFTDTLWPDFDAAAVQAALHWYAQRQRRYGAAR